jgi:hypothetical protein
MIFNQRLIELRDKKIAVIGGINRDIERIGEIDRILNREPGQAFTSYSLRSEENPEK